MAIVSNPVTGRTSKSAGGMVFSTVLGKNVMRSKPFQYRDLKSDTQLVVRSSMDYATKRAVMFKHLFLAFGLKSVATARQIYPHNLIVSYIMSSITRSVNSFVWQPLNTFFGAIDIPNLGSVVCNYAVNKTLTITWKKNIPGSLDKTTDKVSFFMVGIDSLHYSEIIHFKTRNNELAVIDFTDLGFANGKVAVYVQCQDSTQLKNSNFMCIAIVNYVN